MPHKDLKTIVFKNSGKSMSMALWADGGEDHLSYFDPGTNIGVSPVMYGINYFLKEQQKYNQICNRI